MGVYPTTPQATRKGVTPRPLLGEGSLWRAIQIADPAVAYHPRLGCIFPELVMSLSGFKPPDGSLKDCPWCGGRCRAANRLV